MEPDTFELERLIWETVPVASSQVMEVQLQRLLRLDSDQELREGGENDKVFFHRTSASAWVLAEHVIFNGSKESKTTWNRTRQGVRKPDMLYLPMKLQIYNGFSSELKKKLWEVGLRR